MRKRKILTAATAMLFLVSSLAACSEKIDAPYRLPEWTQNIVEPLLGDLEMAYATDKVNLYYDNTQSMYGFAGGGSMVRTVAALRDLANQYSNTTIYTLNGAPGGVLQWSQFAGDLYTSITDFSGFYTVGKGSFANGTGPLQMLYYEGSTLDPAAINVVITDLAEQNVDSGELAARINENILSQDGYSAALIGVLGDFSGKKYVSDLDAVNQMNGVETNGKVPIYILITGKDAALENYVNNLVTAMQDYELVPDSDFFVARYHAGNSAKSLTHDEIITVGPAQEQEGMKKSDWQTAEINENLGLREIDDRYLNTLIDTDDYLNMYAYEFDRDVNGINAGRALLHYYVPIQRTDGLELPTDVKVYTENEQATSTQLQQVYDTKDKIRYSELVEEEPEEAGTAEQWMQEDPAVTGAYEVQNDEGECTKLIGWKDVHQIDYEKDVIVRWDEIIKKGTPVYDMVMQADGRDVGDYYPGTDMGLAENSDLLHITIEFNLKPVKRESGTILLDIPIYAMAQSSENLPDWVTAWDSAGTGDYIYHTFGLENFYRTLFGLNVTGDADYDRAVREVKIAEVLTCVTGLPD